MCCILVEQHGVVIVRTVTTYLVYVVVPIYPYSTTRRVCRINADRKPLPKEIMSPFGSQTEHIMKRNQWLRWVTNITTQDKTQRTTFSNEQPKTPPTVWYPKLPLCLCLLRPPITHQARACITHLQSLNLHRRKSTRSVFPASLLWSARVYVLAPPSSLTSRRLRTVSTVIFRIHNCSVPYKTSCIHIQPPLILLSSSWSLTLVSFLPSFLPSSSKVSTVVSYGR